MDSNHSTYESTYAVRQYAEASELQPPEQTILDQLRAELGAMHVLDLGVGGGRTTVHFAPLAASYVGADYSSGMIDVCLERFAGEPYEFKVADARELPFRDRAFDFVLFSFNGIDYVPHDDRRRVFSEVRRVLRSGGRFAFSTHNLDNARVLLSLKLSRHPRAMLRQWKLLRANPPLREVLSRNWAVLQDGALHGGLETYYVRRDEQLRQLAAAGFTNVSVLQLDGAVARDDATDPWLYYFCTRV